MSARQLWWALGLTFNIALLWFSFRRDGGFPCLRDDAKGQLDCITGIALPGLGAFSGTFPLPTYMLIWLACAAVCGWKMVEEMKRR